MEISLRKARTIIISEQVSPKLTQRVMSQLLWLDSQSEDPIKLYINTPGGSADDGVSPPRSASSSPLPGTAASRARV